MSQGKKRPPANLDEIKALAKILEEAGLTEIEYRYDDLHIRLSKHHHIALPLVSAADAAGSLEQATPPARAAAHSSSSNAGPANFADHPGVVKSPMVGVVYLSPDPTAPPFVTVGDAVNVGDTLVLIEAMKVFNPIKSPVSGKVLRVLVGHSVPVEFGEPLMVIE